MTVRAQTGFTLVELLIVVVVISVLAAIAIPRFFTTRDRSLMTTVASDLKNLASQQEIYYNSYYSFASGLSDMEAVASDGVTITINEADNRGWAATATHVGLPGEQCGIYHGDAAQSNGDPAQEPGLVTCTR